MTAPQSESWESLVQGLFSKALNPAKSPFLQPPAKIRPYSSAAREQERLACQLLSCGAVHYDTVTGAGRMVGAKYQRPAEDGQQQGSASVWALVQPASGGSSLRCSFSASDGAAGFDSAGVEGSVDVTGQLGVDCEFELRPGRAWSSAASISQRLPMLPLTLSHAVNADQRRLGSPERERIKLKHTTSVAVPLPRTAAEFRASLAVPSSLDAHWRPAAAPTAEQPTPQGATGHSSGGSSLADGSSANSTPPSTPKPVGKPLPRRKLTLKLQPQGSHGSGGKPQRGKPADAGAGVGPVPLGSAVPQEAPAMPPPQLSQLQPEEQQQQQLQEKRSAGGARVQTYVPQLQLDWELPEEGPRRISPQDVTWRWRQAWGPRVSSTITVWPAAAGGKGRLCRGLGGRAAAEPEGSEGSEGGGSPPVSPRGSGGSAKAELSGAATSSDATLATGGTPRTVKCQLKCRLASCVTAEADAELDTAALELPGAGRWGLPERGAMLGSVKSTAVKLKCKFGSRGKSGGSGEGGWGPRSLVLQSSLRGAGLSHALTWRHGGKGGLGCGIWGDMQRAQLEIKLQLQPAARQRSLEFECFLPLS